MSSPRYATDVAIITDWRKRLTVQWERFGRLANNQAELRGPLLGAANEVHHASVHLELHANECAFFRPALQYIGMESEIRCIESFPFDGDWEGINKEDIAVVNLHSRKIESMVTQAIVNYPRVSVWRYNTSLRWFKSLRHKDYFFIESENKKTPLKVMSDLTLRRVDDSPSTTAMLCGWMCLILVFFIVAYLLTVG